MMYVLLNMTNGSCIMCIYSAGQYESKLVIHEGPCHLNKTFVHRMKIRDSRVEYSSIVDARIGRVSYIRIYLCYFCFR